MSIILKAEPVVKNLIPNLEDRVKLLKEKNTIPCLNVILVGDNPASVVYTKNKKKFIEEIGGRCDIIHLPAEITPDQFVSEVKRISVNPNVHGCLIQLPLPNKLKNIDTNLLIPPSKDVDGFSYCNLGTLFKVNSEHSSFWPCTPKGIIELLKFYKINLIGQHAVIIGRSFIVGKPLAMLLSHFDATTTLCHSKTKDLKKLTQQADLIFCALGIPKFLKSDFLSPSKAPTIIDIGINKLPNGQICGDVDFDNVKDLVSHISPVPGGVGPLTILALTQNLLDAAETSLKLK